MRLFNINFSASTEPLCSFDRNVCAKVVLDPSSVFEQEIIFPLFFFFFNALVLWAGAIKFYSPDELIATRLNLTQGEADGAYTSISIPKTPLAFVQ